MSLKSEKSTVLPKILVITLAFFGASQLFISSISSDEEEKTYAKQFNEEYNIFSLSAPVDITFCGEKVPTKALRSLKSKGWSPSVGDAGSIEGYKKTLSHGVVSIDIDGIMFIDRADNESSEQKIKVTMPPGIKGIEYSELVREMKGLLH